MNAVLIASRARSHNLKSVLNHKKLLFNKLYNSTHAAETIVIPNRIHRGPTDILRALESTVNRDPTAAHYKYQDDPYLIPSSNIGKRVFAMAQESGRKAAHWVRKEHPDLFQHREAIPTIDVFLPKMTYDENSEVTEADLKSVIADVLVADAAIVYNNLRQKSVEISAETQQDFLEMLCYCNSTDSLSDEFIEERWFRQSSIGRDRPRKTWKDGALAEEVFISLENPNSAAYSAIIQGMCKYYQVQRANELFQEAENKQLELSLEAMNALISCTNFLFENFELRWSFIVEMLGKINQRQLKPNLGTLNAVMECLSIMGTSASTRQLVLKVLREFKELGVEPSLGTWCYVLTTYCKESGPVSTILHDIIPLIENKDHTIQCKKDVNFFVTAMEVCSNHLRDKELAKRVHSVLMYNNNYNLIGDSYKESVYYRHYFLTLLANDTLDDFMQLTYFPLVPHIYVPEPGVMQEILRSVEAHGDLHYLARLWSDMKLFEHSNREQLLEMVLSLMANAETVVGEEEEEKRKAEFASIAWDVWMKVENQPETRIKKLSFTGDMLGTIMIQLLNNDEFDKACEIMNKLDSDQHSVSGVPKIEALALFVQHCIHLKLPTLAINCIQYTADCGFKDADTLAIKLANALTLDETHLHKLSKIVGDFILTIDTKSPTK